VDETAGSATTRIGEPGQEPGEPGGGFTARLTIEFPRVTPARFVETHRWHPVCEFSNWIEAENAAA
jgi:hypothetical protein